MTRALHEHLMASTPPLHEASRLTPTDRNAISDTLTGVIYRDGNEAARNYAKHPNYPTLERIAHHSIGLTAADLRDSELAEIDAIIHNVITKAAAA